MTQAPSIKEALELARKYIQGELDQDSPWSLTERNAAIKAIDAALATLQPSVPRGEAIARAVRSVLMDGLESNDPGNWLVPMYADDIGDLCRHVADALIASGLVQDEAGWRDIITAPKDGTRIFVRRDNGCGTDYMVVWWDDTNNDGYPWQSDNNAYVEDRWDEWMLPPTRSARDGGEE